MGMVATIYPISAESYEAARRGELDKFDHAAPGFILYGFWHAIHYLVTEDSTLTCLLSGTQLPLISTHYEVHAPASIEALHRRLSEMSVEQIMAKFDPATFNQLNIYSGPGWSQYEAPDLQRELELFLSKLKEAADSKWGFLVMIL